MIQAPMADKGQDSEQHSAHIGPTENRNGIKYILVIAAKRIATLSWLSVFLSLAFLALTMTYACLSQRVSYLEVIGGSPSSALLVLRIFSEVASVALAATISAAFERLQWVLTGRADGLPFMDFLTLQAGSGVPGLMGLMVWKGKIKTTTRLCSLIRLVSIVLVPILNILAMSNVETTPVFYQIDTKPTYGFGIGAFNASLAELWAPATDIAFSTDFAGFLWNPALAIDITEAKHQGNCASQGGFSSDCKSKFFIPGGIEVSVQWDLESIDSANTDVYLALDQRGFVFEFGFGNSTQEWVYNSSTECRVYGSELFALSLCLRNTVDQVVQAHIGLCSTGAGPGVCLTTRTSWQSDWRAGWRTSFKASHRNAAVAYSRSNGTILYHEFSNEPASTALINATELLHVFDIIFGADNTNLTIFNSPLPIFGTRNPVRPVLPYYIWWHFIRISELPDISQAYVRAIKALQSLLAITIYNCQAKFLADLKRGLESTLVGRPILAVFPTIKADTTIFPASLRYKIVVGRGSLIAYSLMSGVTWILCVVTLVAPPFNSNMRNRVEKADDTTFFPTLDFCHNCHLYREGSRVQMEELPDRGSSSWKRRILAIADMKVKLS